MIEPLKPKQSLKVAELQDGDIICFQRSTERKASLEKRSGDKPMQETCVMTWVYMSNSLMFRQGQHIRAL